MIARIALAAGALIVIATLATGAAIAVLRSEGGLEWLRQMVERAASSDRLSLSLGALEGPLPERLRIVDLALSDSSGTIVTLSSAELRWRPLDLLRRRLSVDAITIGTVVVKRLPDPPAEESAQSGFDFTGLPSLPVDLVVRALSIDTARLDEAIVGVPVAFSATAALAVGRDGSIHVDVAAAREDGVPARIAFKGDYAAGRPSLRVDLDAAEPAGGVVAALLDLPGRPPVRATLNGDGRLDDWAGRFEARAEGVAAIAAEVSVQGSRPAVLRLHGHADIEGALPPPVAPLVAGGVALEAVVSADEEWITLSELTLRTASGRLVAQGDYGRIEKSVDGSAHLAFGPAAVFQGLVPDLGYSDLATAIDIAGTVSAPVSRLTLKGRDVSVAARRVAVLDVSARIDSAGVSGSEEAPLYRFDLQLAADGIRTPEPDLERLLAAGISLTSSGTVNDTTRRVVLDRLALTAGPIDLNGRLEVDGVDPPTGRANLAMVTDLRPFGGLIGTPIGGTSELALAVALSDREMTGTIDGSVEALSIDSPELAALLGRRLVVRAHIRRKGDAPYGFDATVAGEGIDAVADGALSSEFNILENGRLQVVIPNLEPLRTALPDLRGGRMALTATAQGPVAALNANVRLDGSDVRHGDHRLDRVSAVVDATNLPARPQGSVAVDVAGTLGAMSLDGPFAVDGGERLRLPELTLTYERVLKATADLTLPMTGGPLSGHVTAAADTLAPIGDRWRVPIEGGMTLNATLGADGGRQRLRGELFGSQLRYGPAAAPTASINKLSASFDLVDPATAGGVFVSAEAVGIGVADGHLDRTKVELTGSDGRYAVSAQLAGDVQGLRRLATQADVRTGNGTTEILLRTLDGELAGAALRLARPARLTVQGDTLSLTDLTVLHGEATATVELEQSPQSVEGLLAVRNVDLAMIGRFAPDIDLAGRLVADMRISGSPKAPRLVLDAKATRLGSTQRMTSGGKASALSATVTAEAAAGRAATKVTIDGFGGRPLEARLVVPFHLAIAPVQIDLPMNGPIEGSVRWQGAIGPPLRILPIDEVILDGEADVDLSIAGTLGRPAVNGRFVLEKGRLEVFETGTILAPLRLEVAFKDHALRVVRLDAGDGARGRVEGAGHFDWTGSAPEVDAAITIRDATLVRRDDVTARVSGEIALRGAVGKKALLTVALTNEATEIRLVDRLPPSIPTVDVAFVDELKKHAGSASRSELGWLQLDARFDAPRRVFVRGRGLQSEWGGRVQAEGPLANPTVRGRIEPIRGELSLLSKIFVLQAGSIVIDGLDQDLRIDVTAAYRRRDFRALVNIAGTTSAPKLTVSSVPELPENEVLSRILFNKGSGRLTPGEAVQIAAAAQSLASGEPGILDRLRDATGLDRFMITGGQENERIGAVEAGRYVSERVYTGVEQGATAGTTAFVVEIDISETIKARSSNTGDGLHRFGLFWSIEY